LFGVLAAIAWTDNNEIHNTLDQRTQAAADEAAAKQKVADTEANLKANEAPYKTYTAKPEDGGFALQIPKNWSVYTARNTGGSVQLGLLSDPETVIDNIGANANNTHALVVQLQRKSVQDVLKGYSERVKKKQLTQTSVQISGMAAVKLEGAIDDQRHTGVVVVLGVRDKTMTFIVQDTKYLDQFNQIITNAKINP
jgi:hypothetical protein